MKSLLILCVVSIVVLAGCASLQAAAPAASPVASDSSNLPNPASVYCKEHGGSLEIRTDATGAQSGVCIFPGGSECDEWAYFRGQCAPAEPAGSQMTEGQARAAASAANACTEVGQLKEKAVFNPNSRTWWIDLDGTKPGCNPACVIKEDGSAEVNWRCTGAVPPADAPAQP